MNAAAYKAVSRCDDVNPVAPVNPPIRFLYFQGTTQLRAFQGISTSSQMNAEVQAACDPNAQLDFFHGFTPWIQTNPQRPYLAWSDCLFHDYIRIYHRCGTFRRSDIDRIEETESAWLNRPYSSRVDGEASRAGRFSEGTDWFGRSFRKNGISSQMPSQEHLHFYSLKAKGGPTVVAAFERIRQSYPEATLTVIGDGLGLRDGPGIIETWLAPEGKPCRRCALSLKGKSHCPPTRSDILPLILIEAGYFGVPSISSNIQAISEWIAHGSNRYPANHRAPNSTNEVESAMQRILDPNYNSMRTESWRKAREEFSRDRFDDRLIAEVNQFLNRPTK